MTDFVGFPLGRLVPADFEHVEKYPFGYAAPTVNVEVALRLPGWIATHDQGREGSCVGHAVVLERAITNSAQARQQLPRARPLPTFRRYDPVDLWNEAKRVDEWPDTNPGDENGTSVRAAYDVARDRGPRPCRSMHVNDQGVPIVSGQGEPSPADGVGVTRWARTVDEMRAGILVGLPIAIGIDWFVAFDKPLKRGKEFWLTEKAAELGNVRGGHSVCLYGASDKRQAFRLRNSWGLIYPSVWLPYTIMELLLSRGGEAALVTDL